jgi:DNA polymerase III epsilon subunit-like protein
VSDFAAFLDVYRDVELKSKRTGRPYRVARIGGHNIAGFDLDRLGALFKQHGVFLPIDFSSALDTRFGAVWYCEQRKRTEHHEGWPADYKLTTLCAWFGIPITEAHEALADVRLTVQLAKALLA